MPTRSRTSSWCRSTRKWRDQRGVWHAHLGPTSWNPSAALTACKKAMPYTRIEFSEGPPTGKRCRTCCENLGLRPRYRDDPQILPSN